MKLSLLELTQNILSSLDSDEVNSISDTAESRQVAQIIKTTYFNILSRADLPENKNLFQLTSSGSVSQPTLMTKPATVSRIEWIKYNKETASDTTDMYQYVTILPLQQYLDYTHQLDIDDSTVDSMTLLGMTFYYNNNAHPDYCAIVDDQYVVFNSYLNTLDATLQSAKTICFGQFIPVFTMEDSFTPDLDDQQFPLLLNEAKSLAYFELKQMPHQKAEQESRRQWRTLQRTKALGPPTSFENLPDFGRKPRRVRFK